MNKLKKPQIFEPKKTMINQSWDFISLNVILVATQAKSYSTSL